MNRKGKERRVEQAVAMYVAGQSIHSIAKRLKVSAATVRYYLRDAKVKLRTRVRRDAPLAGVAKLLLSTVEKLGQSGAARQFHVSRQAVHARVLKLRKAAAAPATSESA